jgi:hypothetical protein
MTAPVPAASFPLPPPLAAMQLVDPRTGRPTTLGISFLTNLWAGVQGGGGTVDQITVLQALVNTLYNMSGDATISATGAITVVSSEGRPFVNSAFTDTTNAGNISAGFLPAARIQDGSLVQAKITGLASPVLVSALPTPTAGLRAIVTDANATTFASIVAGGGANTVPVFADGTNWRIG